MVVVVNCGVLGWHLALTQLQMPGLVASVGLGLWWGWSRGRDQGGTQTGSISKCECLVEQKLVKSVGGLLVAMLAMVFFSSGSCWGHVQGMSLGTVVASTM